ncbi:MAG TPA: DUF3108 domain-containing protein [Polyangia bacterium]|nr:DUF3108 domain-containing protein [Polyangia bacterium]
MHALHLLVAAMRLSCWPFEVEGQGQTLTTPPEIAVPPAISAPRPAPLPPKPPASLPRNEVIRYDIRYGLFGSIGELSVTAGGLTTDPNGATMVKLRGAGRGAVLGLGGMQRRIEAEFDSRALGSRRWTVGRRKESQRDDEETVDIGEHNERGETHLQRHKPGGPDETQAFRSNLPTSDPLGMIWRFRTAPPALGATDTMHVLDGLALWQVRATTVSQSDAVPDGTTVAMRLEGEINPVHYDGSPDPGRTGRKFTLWLDRQTSHVPLRLEVPVGPSDLVMQLVEAKNLAETSEPRQLGTPAPGARSL